MNINIDLASEQLTIVAIHEAEAYTIVAVILSRSV